jgi:hypothetical protein
MLTSAACPELRLCAVVAMFACAFAVLFTGVASASLAAPTALSPPAVLGIASPGQVLNAAPSAWTGEPTSRSVQWEDCDPSGQACSPSLSATGPTYVIPAGEIGRRIRVRETASNEAGAGEPAFSLPSAVVALPAPVSATPPTVAGTPVEGQTLSAAGGSWIGFPASITIQWLRCDGLGSGCLMLPGANEAGYELGPPDVGHMLRVSETASNSGGSSAPAVSLPVGPVRAGVPALPYVPPVPRGKPPSRGGGYAGPTQDRGLHIAYCAYGRAAGAASVFAPLAVVASTSHAGWPADECLKMDKGPAGRRHTLIGLKGVHNWLLGGYGNDTIMGANRGDVIWSDYHPNGEPKRQTAVIHAGNGKNFIYANDTYNSVWTGTNPRTVVHAHATGIAGVIHCESSGIVVFLSTVSEKHFKLDGCHHISHYSVGY